LNEQLKQDFLLGNEAIARGALEANVDFITGYPGTPSSEVLETVAREAKKYGIYAAWATNEKVAFENAMGASLAGLRAMVTMKHAGLNWVADPLSVAVLGGVRGGLVILTADDPNCHSSANEQDNRFYGLFFKILTLEPSDPQEAKDMTIEAFSLSERSELPVIIRNVTRVAHARSNVALGKMIKKRRKAHFDADPERFFITGRRGLEGHRRLIEKQPFLERLAEGLQFNQFTKQGEGKTCLITSGIAHTHALDALRILGIKSLPILKLGVVYPLPKSLIKRALLDKDTILVLEEGDRVIELQTKALASGINRSVRILGRESGHIPGAGELNVDIIAKAIAEVLGKKPRLVSMGQEALAESIAIMPTRTMVFCAGCPHSGTMYALKKVIKKKRGTFFVGGDIGCYTLMCYPPHELGDTKYSMGASIGVASGMSKVMQQKTVAVIGDSTFIHAGIQALINCVYNQSSILVVICDNGTTAMTGGQPHAGTGITATGKKTNKIDLEQLVRGCGVEFVEVTDPYNISKTKDSFESALKYEGVSVVISRRACALEASRLARRLGEKLPTYHVDTDKCVKCWQCVKLLACPAIIRDGEEVAIDNSQCTGCGICAQICPVEAILPGEVSQDSDK